MRIQVGDFVRTNVSNLKILTSSMISDTVISYTNTNNQKCTYHVQDNASIEIMEDDMKNNNVVDSSKTVRQSFQTHEQQSALIVADDARDAELQRARDEAKKKGG